MTSSTRIKPRLLDWTYSSASDVLYLTDGVPRETVELEAGKGLYVRYDRQGRTCVGFTIFGVRRHARQVEEEDGDESDRQLLEEELTRTLIAVGRGEEVDPGKTIRLMLRVLDVPRAIEAAVDLSTT